MTSKEAVCETPEKTGIRKVASFTFSDFKPCMYDGVVIKTASTKNKDGSSEADRVLAEQIEKHPNSLFFRAKAIEADIPNNNGDSFSTSELKRACQTFVGVPFFTNHQNDDVEKARGKIVFAEWDEKDKAIYVIAFVDREAYPHLCRGIEQEYVTGVSMGAVCSGTKVWKKTSEGLIETPIENIEVGDAVLSANSIPQRVKKTHCEYLGTSMFRPITKTYHKSPWFTFDHPVAIIDKNHVESSKEDAIKIAQKNKYMRRTEKTDVFIGQDGWRKDNYKLQYRYASDLGIGDHILVPTRYKFSGRYNSPETYYIIGAYLGDGFVKKDKLGNPEGVCFCLGMHEKELISRITSYLQDISLNSSCRFDSIERNGTYITVYDRKLAKTLLESVGTGSKTKRICNLSIPTEECAKNLLSGYLDTDGCIVDKTNQDVRGSKFGGFQISSANVGLLEDIQNLLIALGHVSRISTFCRTPSETSVVNIDTIEHTLAIGSNCTDAFPTSLKFVNSGFSEAEINAGSSFVTEIDGVKYMACPIVEVENNERWNEPVYDLTVENDETYIADGMGIHNCSVEYSVCSICGNKAATQDDYCYHIRNLKGRKFTGQVTDVRTGETKKLKEAAVFEDNYGIRFIELSGVVDPACASCQIQNIYQNDQFTKAASTAMRMANGLSMFKTSAKFQKEASEQDIQKLNEALATLQDIAIKLIQQRENIEMEFSADLVKILADLQEYVDGLVQAGFGRLPDIPGNLPDEGMPQGGDLMGGPSAGEMPPEGGMEQPIAAEESLGGDVGEVSGNPGAPLVEGPQAGLQDFQQATRPSPSGAQRSTTLKRPVSPRNASQDEEVTNMRRLPQQVNKQKRSIITALDDAWQENLEKVSNSLSESLVGDLASNSSEGEKTGGIGMSDQIKTAKAKETQNMVTEKRLDTERGGKSSRREDTKDQVLGKQLAEKDHWDNELDEVENGILEEVRADTYPKEVSENQLEPNREGEVAHKTLQGLMEEQRTGDEPNEIIESLLSHPKVDTPSTRTASLNDHVAAAVEILGKTIVASQATPKVVTKIAGKMGSSSIFDQLSIAKKIDEFDGEVPSFSGMNERTAFWGGKGITTAAATDSQIRDMIVAYAGKAVKGSDLSPEFILRAMSVLKNSPHSEAVLAAKVDELMKSNETVDVEDIESAMGNYLASMTTKVKTANKKEDVKPKDKKANSSQKQVEAETKALATALEKEAEKDASIIIETNFDEMKVDEKTRNDESKFRAAVEAFTNSTCKTLGLKVAAVLNVTVDAESGDVVIAVDTDQGGSVEIPASENEEPISDDLGLDDDIDIEPEVGSDISGDIGAEPSVGEDFGATGAPLANEKGGVGSFTAAKKTRLKREAQFGGGDPGMGAGGAQPADSNAPGDPTAGLAAGPGESDGLQSFTGEDEEMLPGDEEQMMPGSICPVCGSTDTETGKKDQSPGQFDCNSCGVKYSYHVNVELLNPERLLDGGVDLEDELESPEAPSMPVAAMIDMDRTTFRKVAEMQKQIGHVCPACGSNEVETNGTPIESKISCSKCKTVSEKSMLVNVDNPIQSSMRVSWSIDPMKRKCASCRQNAKKFAAENVFGAMVKRASTIELPDTKIRAWLKSNYPGVVTVTNGPFKGDKFADTVIGQMQRFGFTKAKYLKALADSQSCEDPMDTCMKDHKKQGFKVEEASRLCDCLKQKYWGEEDENIYMQALGGMVDKTILRKMASMDKKSGSIEKESSSFNGDASIFDFPEVVAEVSGDVTTAEQLKSDLQDEINLIDKVASEDGVTKMERGKEKEKKVQDVETMADDKSEKPNSSRGTIGNEKSEKIPGPKVPRGDATMGKETKPPAEGVKVPSKGKETDNYDFDQKIDNRSLGIGTEAKGKGGKMDKVAYGEIEPMKKVENPNVKNPDDTSGDTALQERADSEKGVQVVESIEDHDDVVRDKSATINEESPLSEGGPDVPRASANMGNEKPFSADSPSIPSEVAETDTTMRGRQAERERQLEKIASARREHAQRFAGQLLGKGVIKDEEVDDFVNDMSLLPLDRMQAHFSRMMTTAKTNQKTASTQAAPMLATPIVKESETFVQQDEVTEVPLAERLSGLFTIGGRNQNRAIRQAMADDAEADEKLGW